MNHDKQRATAYKGLRKARGYTLEQLGEVLGLQASTLSKRERALQPVTVEAWRALESLPVRED